MSGDVERIQPTEPVAAWPSITRRRRDDEPGPRHESHEEPPEDEDEDTGDGGDEQPHIDIRV